MSRPRWHDAAIIAAIVGLLGAGAWALWWDDLRGALNLDPRAAPRGGSASVASGQT